MLLYVHYRYSQCFIFIIKLKLHISCDGVPNMSGEFQGIQVHVRVKEVQPLALAVYNPFAAHRLNPVLIDTF